VAENKVFENTGSTFVFSYGIRPQLVLVGHYLYERALNTISVEFMKLFRTLLMWNMLVEQTEDPIFFHGVTINTRLSVANSHCGDFAERTNI